MDDWAGARGRVGVQWLGAGGPAWTPFRLAPEGAWGPGTGPRGGGGVQPPEGGPPPPAVRVFRNDEFVKLVLHF